jgi:hypothetical protein
LSGGNVCLASRNACLECPVTVGQFHRLICDAHICEVLDAVIGLREPKKAIPEEEE